MTSFKGMVNKGLHFVQKNQSTILTALGVAGLVSTGVLTAQATIKAVRKCDNYSEDLTMKERFLLTWRMYIPPVAMGAVSIACIIGAHSADAKKNAALAGLYAVTEETLQDYRKKVVEKIGEKKEEEVYGEVVDERMRRHPVATSDIVQTGNGDVLFYDTFSGRKFYSNIEAIRKAENYLNKNMIYDFGHASLNDFYCEIGLGEVKIGEALGWTTDNLIDVKFSSRLTEDGTPCAVIDLNARPF